MKQLTKRQRRVLPGQLPAGDKESKGDGMNTTVRSWLKRAQVQHTNGVQA